MSREKIKTLRLILGDQLNAAHSWFKRKDDSVTYLMMELSQETDYVMHHVQKICGFFLAMRQFAARLRSAGHEVIYLRLDDKDNYPTLDENIAKIVKNENCERFEYIRPDEYRLDRQIRQLSKALPCPTEARDSEHFLTTRNDVGEFFKERREYRMEYFYRHMRKKYNILMDKDKPAGDRWNFDVENRSKYTGQVPLPEPLLFSNDVSDIHAMLDRCGTGRFGRIEPREFIWPVNRRQALRLLKYFLQNQLAYFGTYQDAMLTDAWLLFHSRLSFALNTKILHPREVIDRVIDEWRERSGEISLAQVEGFARQLLGWREYMRGMYWMLMPGLAKMNYFGHVRKLPRFYWTGKTKMNCMKRTIEQSLQYAYAHHIQRLMITGNFALLTGIDPDQVEAWYLGIYIDAVEWVEKPNTRGMSQFADGGLVASKPYVSTANYINSMSDYCRSCHYSFKKRHGENACPFNSLHWRFYDRHRRKLSGNPRVATMYRTWDRMDKTEKAHILEQAGRYLNNIERL